MTNHPPNITPIEDTQRFAFIFAVDELGGFGNRGGLPWPRVEADMKRFRELTLHNTLCVGKTTAATIPPLKDRTVLTLTHRITAEDSADPSKRYSWVIPDPFILSAKAVGGDKRIFFGGGALALWELNDHPDILLAYVSVIHGGFVADVRFSLHGWLRLGKWVQTSKVEAEGVTFYEYARGAACPT